MTITARDIYATCIRDSTNFADAKYPLSVSIDHPRKDEIWELISEPYLPIEQLQQMLLHK